MNEEIFIKKRDKAELVISEIYQKIRKEQLEMIVELARNNYNEIEIKGMLRLISKTDDWEDEFKKIQEKRSK